MKLTILLLFISITSYSQKDSIIKAPADTVNIISIADIKVLMTAIENEPGFTKHDYDKVSQAISFLVNTAMIRRQKPKK